MFNENNTVNNMFKSAWKVVKRKKFVLNSMSVAVASVALMYSSVASANANLPTGGTYVDGNGNISNTGTNVDINQSSQYGIIDWQGFSIGVNNAVNIVNGTGHTLNRVVGNGVSNILGQLNATGSAYLINENGIVIGQSGQITTGGHFVGSTHNVANADFMNGGDLTLSNSNAGIVNLGQINTGGNAYLLGKTVLNEGSVNAAGDSILAAGEEILLTSTESGIDGVYVQVASDSHVTNKGLIEGVNVALRASADNLLSLAINNEGTVRATGIQNEGGRIILSAKGSVENSGTLDASSAGVGGDVTVEGDHVTLTSASIIDASGTTGGNVRVGGGYQGNDSTIRNSQSTTVAQGAVIDASASDGDAGEVIVWSDGDTNFAGEIDVSASDNGGFAEVSGKQNLVFSGWNVNTKGGTSNGTLLLDPTDINIVDGVGGGVASSPVTANTLYDADIADYLQNTGSLTITTSSGGTDNGDITIDNNVDITWSANNSLVASATRDINLAGNIDASAAAANASVTMLAGRDINVADATIKSGKAGTIALRSASPGNYKTDVGSVNFGSNVKLHANQFVITSGKIDLGGGNFSRSDLNNNVELYSLGTGMRSIILRGFKDVDLNFNGNSDIATTQGSFNIEAQNIVFDENVTTIGDFIVEAASYDENFDYGVDNWKTEQGTIQFAGGNTFNGCCVVSLKSGVDGAGNRVDLTAADLTFGYSKPLEKSYTSVNIQGFDTFNTTVEGNRLSSAKFVNIENVNNVIGYDIDAGSAVKAGVVNSNGNITIIADQDTTLEAGVDLAATEKVTIVVDEQSPLAPSTGKFVMDATSTITSGAETAIFTSRQGQNSIAGTINGGTFTPGTEYTNTATEEWVIFYQNGDRSGANPYQVYYKDQATINLPNIDCENNPSQAGCDNFVEFVDSGKTYSVSMTEDNTAPEEGVLAYGNSAQVRTGEMFTAKTPDYTATSLETSGNKLTLLTAVPTSVLDSLLLGITVPGLSNALDLVTKGPEVVLNSIGNAVTN